MSTRPRIPVLIGAVCAAMLLAGCSSSGTVSGSQGSAGGAGGLLGGSSGGTGGTGGTSGGTGGTGGTSGGTGDAGCNQAMLAIQSVEKAQNNPNLQAAVQTANTGINQLRGAAASTQKPGGKDAMNKVADDLQSIVSQAAAGQQPDTQQAFTDAQSVVQICQH